MATRIHCNTDRHGVRAIADSDLRSNPLKLWFETTGLYRCAKCGSLYDPACDVCAAKRAKTIRDAEHAAELEAIREEARQGRPANTSDLIAAIDGANVLTNRWGRL